MVRLFRSSRDRLECLFLPDLVASYRSWCVFRHLRARDFDRILFLDRGAPGYWCIRARKQGIAFAQTGLALIVADPSELGFREQWTDPPEPRYLLTLEMERFQLHEAGTILAMSADLAAYVRRSGVTRPAVVIPEVLPASLLAAITEALMARARFQIPGDVAGGPLPEAITLGLLGLADEASDVRRIAELVPRIWSSTGPVVAGLLAIGGTGLLVPERTDIFCLPRRCIAGLGGLNCGRAGRSKNSRRMSPRNR